MAAGGVEIVYLTLQDALELYAAITAHYQDADLALQAAVLAHGIAEGQPFLDGNKRLAFVAMLTFLEANGYRVDAADPELADWIINLSSGLTSETLAERLRQRLIPVHSA